MATQDQQNEILNRMNIDLKSGKLSENQQENKIEDDMITKSGDEEEYKGQISPKIVETLNFKQKESKTRLRSQVPMTSPILEKLNKMNDNLQNQCSAAKTEDECTKFVLCGWCTNGKCLLGDAKGPVMLSACHAPEQWHVVTRKWDVPTQVWAAAQMQVYNDNKYTVESPHVNTNRNDLPNVGYVQTPFGGLAPVSMTGVPNVWGQ